MSLLSFLLFFSDSIYQHLSPIHLSIAPLTERQTHGNHTIPMGVDYVVIGFDMEVQPLVTLNAA